MHVGTGAVAGGAQRRERRLDPRRRFRWAWLGQTGLAAAAAEGCVCVCDTAAGSVRRIGLPTTAEPRALCETLDGRVAVIGADGTVRLWRPLCCQHIAFLGVGMSEAADVFQYF